MAKIENSKGANLGMEQPTPASTGRRTFLRRALTAAGLLALGGTLAAGACRCDDDEPEWSDQQNEGGNAAPPPENKPPDNPPPTEDPDEKKPDEGSEAKP